MTLDEAMAAAEEDLAAQRQNVPRL
jgi:hypothetical protein